MCKPWPVLSVLAPVELVRLARGQQPLRRGVRATCRQDLKELKLRPSTDVHDYQVRLRAAQKFLAKVGSLKLPCLRMGPLR